MKPHLPNSPRRLALVAILGCLITAIFFIIPWPERHSGQFKVFALLAFAVFAGGLILSLKCTTNLKHGVQNQEWPESQIEPLRIHLESPWYTVLSMALLVAFVLFESLFRRRLGGEGWACFLLSQTLSQLRIAVRRPVTRTPSGPLGGWRDYLAPIHSDQWGQR